MCILQPFLSCRSSYEAIHILKQFSRPFKSSLIIQLGLAQALWVRVLRYLKFECESKVVCLVCYAWELLKLVSWCASLLGVLVARRQVYDPPTWCGAVLTILCGGRGDLHPLWRSSLVENRIKVTVVTWCSRKRLDCREAILLVSVSTIWSRTSFVPNRTTR